jgi:hypothetical protein
MIGVGATPLVGFCRTGPDIAERNGEPKVMCYVSMLLNTTPVEFKNHTAISRTVTFKPRNKLACKRK